MNDTDAILLDPADHVATVLRQIAPGEILSIAGPGGIGEVIAAEPIPIFHKIAIRALPSGADVLKYGDTIGVLIAAVDQGALVHVHNLRSKRAADQRR